MNNLNERVLPKGSFFQKCSIGKSTSKYLDASINLLCLNPPSAVGGTDQVRKLPPQHRGAWSPHHRVVPFALLGSALAPGHSSLLTGMSSGNVGGQRQVLVTISIDCRHRIGVS